MSGENVFKFSKLDWFENHQEPGGGEERRGEFVTK